MQFVKKNYEKIVLGVILLGLLAAVGSLPFLVANEKAKLSEFSQRTSARNPRPLPAPDVSGADALLKRTTTRVNLVFADNEHKLLNPVRWQRRGNEAPIKNPQGTELRNVVMMAPTNKPLYLKITFEATSVSDVRTVYTVAIEEQAASRQRQKRPYYVAVGEKKQFGENNNSFVIRDVQGPTNSPTALVIELGDMDSPITVPQDPTKPYQRVDGYMTDLKYVLENRPFPNRRKGDKITVAGEDYNIVAITENEVVLSAKNQTKWTIRYSAEP